MSKRFWQAIVLVLVLSLASGAWANLVGQWKLDEGSGITAHDSSGNGYDGTLQGNPQWVTGVIGSALKFDGTNSVNCGSAAKAALLQTLSITCWVNPSDLASGVDHAFTGRSAAGIGYAFKSDSTHLRFTTPAVLDHDGANSILKLNTWQHVAVTFTAGKAGGCVFYINGVVTDTLTASTIPAGAANVEIGHNHWDQYCMGMMDDVRIYDHILTQKEVQDAMKGEGPGAASGPSPADKATDVPADTVLGWTAGKFAATHDVYLGTTFADVNSASRTKPGSVLVSQGQTNSQYASASLLTYGQTYYWRIDEVNKAPDNTIYKSTVWSFTTEPYAYPIPGRSITATASSAQLGAGPEKTIDGSGLDASDEHGSDSNTMWMTTGQVLPNWIQYQFDKAYKLWDMKVWNSNLPMEAFIGFGAKDVKVEYSTDGTTWTALANVPQFARASGLTTYTANTTVSFGGVMAQYVRLTINSSWGGLPQVGLSEVRFSYEPVLARSPAPATGTAGVSVSATMNWRPGREATSHKVFFGTDPNAVAKGTATSKTVTAHSFDPGGMTFGTTYYWRVDEVGGAGPYAGDVWSFTTQEFAAVDDFESYNDDNNRIYNSWIDGYTDGKSGSMVGYLQAPFAEQTIVHGGKQSMPLEYNNVKTPYYSEATRDLGTAQDWTGNGATHLDLWFRGYAAPTVAVNVTNGALTLTGDGTDIWNNADDFAFAYKTLTGDGSIVARVVNVGTGTNTWAKGGVMIRADLTAGSTDAYMVITAGGGNGASFQYRLTANGACANTDSTAVLTAPYWVKLDRKGNTLTGSVSADGKTWTTMGTPQTIAMTGPVDIGLCVCAHQAGEYRTMQFDNITATGNVGSTWQGADQQLPAQRSGGPVRGGDR